MTAAARSPKILLIDTNVYFSKRLSDALKRECFEVTSSTQPAFALTTLEYDAPTAIVCSTNMREMGALDIARMMRADAKNADSEKKENRLNLGVDEQAAHPINSSADFQIH